MTARALLLFALMAVAVRVEAGRPNPKERSVSGSQQFVIYCPDAALRGRIAGLVEEWKTDVLGLLDERPGRAKIPVILSLAPANGEAQPPVNFQMFTTPEGMKIEVHAVIGEDPSAVNLRKQVVRALLLEIIYRERSPLKVGERYVEAPWWLIDGALEIFQRQERGVNSELFRRLVENNKFPSIEELLTLRAGGLGAAAEAVDSACAMGLVQTLLEQPNGRANLGRLLRRWPEMSGDPMGALARDFPGLAFEGKAAQKWWTLNLARLAAADRYQGLSLAETNQQLTELLKLELVVDKAGAKKTFTVDEYAEFLSIPKSRAALADRQRAIVVLATQANALFRPVLAEYEQIVALLARGKTRRISERLASVERLRALVLTRMSDVANYLNWFEATQFQVRTHDFDSYLKAAHELSRQQSYRPDQVTKYLDQIEKEY